MSFCVGNKRIWLRSRAHLLPRTSAFSPGSEHFWCWRRTHLALSTNEASAFGALEERARSALKTNAFSTKDGTHLTLKANVFGATNELTRLVIATNALVFGDKL